MAGLFGPKCCAERGNVGAGMAAGRKGLISASRGATTGQGAEVQREGQAPSPSSLPLVTTLDSLEEISGWLGTFRERLRQARADERSTVAAVVEQLEARYVWRRAELS